MSLDGLNLGNSRESASEYSEDMLVAAGKDLTALMMLKKCYEEMIEIAKPYCVEDKIKVPGGKLPFERISQTVQMAVNKMDRAFIETMAISEFLSIFEEGLAAVKKKIEKLEAQGEGLGRDLR